jgi:hypothetical protein
MTHSGHSQEYFNLNSKSRVITTKESVEDKSGLLKIAENFTTVYLTIFNSFFKIKKKKLTLNIITYVQYNALV